MKVDYQPSHQEYTESKLIAYIGNKRRLLSLIIQAFEFCDLSYGKNGKAPTFLDLFAGTGVVSRFAKSQGMQVICNDWEDYTYILNSLYIQTNPSELKHLYQDKGGLPKVLDILNQLSPLPYEKSYIAQNYCPFDTKNPDLENERLFYTRENGEKIDAIREKIEEWYPEPVRGQAQKEKNILLALLLYEVATRANTSGVFKGFHYGFGGTGKDALKRIFKPLTLEYPILWENKHNHQVLCQDANSLANELAAQTQVDIAYVDPPYNQHQYGSNYHMLNTVLRNDKPEINQHIMVNGKKKNKSAIRADWVKTKSGYCYRQYATQLFADLMESIRAHYIMISYSNEGIIPFDTLLEILSKKGKLDIITSQYTKYRGGKQALTSLVSNIEFVLIVNTHQCSNHKDIQKVKSHLLNQYIHYHASQAISLEKLLQSGYKIHQGDFENMVLSKKRESFQWNFNLVDTYGFDKKNPFGFFYKNGKGMQPIAFNELDWEVQQQIHKDLKQATQITREEELDLILDILLNYGTNYEDETKFLHYFSKVPYLYKKYNNKKAYLPSLIMGLKILKVVEDILFSYPSMRKNLRFQSYMDRLESLLLTKLKVKNDHLPDVKQLKQQLSQRMNRVYAAKPVMV